MLIVDGISSVVDIVSVGVGSVLLSVVDIEGWVVSCLQALIETVRGISTQTNFYHQEDAMKGICLTSSHFERPYSH